MPYAVFVRLPEDVNPARKWRFEQLCDFMREAQDIEQEAGKENAEVKIFGLP